LNKRSCTHCHLEFDESVLTKEIVDGKECYFCCNGCQGVYHLLYEQNLESFYDKSGGVKLTPLNKTLSDSSSFDSEAFYEQFVRLNSDGLSEVSLAIEGIHCSACVWLNEKVLNRLDGVIEANINFTSNKANVMWDDTKVKLSTIIDTIRAIGYDAFAYDSEASEKIVSRLRKSYYLKMAVAIFASMNVMWIAVAQYAGYFSGMDQDIKTILNIAEGILATPVLFYSGWVFFRGAYFGLKNRTINMDLLVSTGATLTYLYSIYITIIERGEAYFDSVTMIITFILIGKFLEILSKKSASDTLDLITKDIPSSINILRDGMVVSLKLKDVVVGDTIIVSSGQKVLFDSIITKGSGSFDESSISGESRAVHKNIGDNIISGTISIDADVEARVLKDFKHSTFSNIVSLLEGALSKKPHIELLANRLSEYFSAVILTIALATFLFWYFMSGGFEHSFMVAVSVIIIACPCALALATPVATLVGLGNSVKRGILFKEASHLESIAKIDTLVLDKTGTLTKGNAEVVKTTHLKEFDESFLYSLLSPSSHPISKAIVKHLGEQKVFGFDSYTQLSARGIKATLGAKTYLGGNEALLKENGIDFSYKSDKSLFYYAVDGEVVGVFELEDSLKDGALEFIKSMKKMGLKLYLLSGDHKEATTKIAGVLGIESFLYEQKPEDKANFITSLQDDGKKVAMAGDGINDILALANANISVSMGGGSDIAIEVGDIVLLDDSLESLKEAFSIGKNTYSLIKQNIAISLTYNSITVPLAMMGYVIPLVAAISMSFSSLLVVLNSLRARR
jgi:Cu+-exporting ATPase